MLKYFNFEPCFKLQWCGAGDLSWIKIPATTAGFEFVTSHIKCRCLTHAGLPNFPRAMEITIRAVENKNSML